MRNNKMKGFTLVELLVVIAILAILATVSVVGYTSYIEGATVRVDEDLAAQLTRFLEAYKVNHPDEITEDNIWQITQDILEESGINELNPKSGDYGHHFYFDFETKTYVVLSDEEAIDTNSGFENLWELIVGAEETESKYNVRPGNFFTLNNQYFLVDTTGALAEVVNGFYTFDGTAADLKTLYDNASKIKDADGDTVDALLDMIKETVFVTTSGNLVYDLETEHKYIFIDEDVTVIPNIKTDKDGRPQAVSAENPLITTGETVTVRLPKGVTLYGDSLNIKVLDGGNVVVSIDAENWNDVIDLVDANFTNNSVTVELNGANYKVNEYIVNTTIVQDGTIVGTTDVATVLKYKYRLDSFNAGIVDNNDNKVHNVPVANPGIANNATGYTAWEKGEFYLDITSALGTGEDKSIISTYDVEWALGTITWQAADVDDYGVANDGTTKYITVSPEGKVTLAKGLAPKINEFTVTATATVDRNGYVKGYHDQYKAENAAQQTITVKVVRVQSASFTLAGNALIDGDPAILIHGAESNNHSATLTKINYVNELSDIVLTDTLTLANVGTPVGFGVVDNKVQTSALAENVKEGSGSITITIGNHTKYTASIVTYDTSKLPLQPKFNANRVGNNANEIFNLHIGNGNAISISDLFTGTIPADAELIAFGVAPNGSYMNYNGRVEIPTRAEADALIKEAEDNELTAPTIAVTADYVTNDGVTDYQSLDFAGVRDGIITIAVYRNGVRISDDITFYLVDGYNVSDYVELAELMGTKNVLSDSVVFLGDMAMENADGTAHAKNYFNLPSNKIIYGNNFELDIANGVELNYYGIITLSSNSTMRDLKVVGKVYPSVVMSASEQYGTNAVDAYAGTTISNCYIANCRSPLIINGSNTTSTDPVILKDSVIFGGVYANVDLRHGSLKIEGKVSTVQQPVKSFDNSTTVMGVGVSAWFEDDQKHLIIDDLATFKQYNFLNSSAISYLKPLKYKGVTLMELNAPFNKLFDDDYDANHFGDSTPYVNSGVVSVDQYMFGVSVSGLQSQLSPGNKKDDVITVKLVAPKGVDLTGKKVDLHFDAEKYNDYQNGNTDGVVEQLDASTLITSGYSFKCKTDTWGWKVVIPWIQEIYTEYDFYFAYPIEPDPNDPTKTIASTKYNTLQVTGLKNYDTPKYEFDLRESFELLAKADVVIDVSLHTKGLHYTMMPSDIWSPDVANHGDWFDDYIEMSDSNNANYQYYAPTKADGTNGYDFDANGALPDFPQS